MKTRRILMSMALFALGACSKSGAEGTGTGGQFGTGGIAASGGNAGSGGVTGGGGTTGAGGAGGSTGTGNAAGGRGTPDGGMGAIAGRADAGVTGSGGTGGTTTIGRDAGSDAAVAVAPASAFVCGNWADQRDNFVNGNLEPSGLSATTDTYATVLSKADQILASLQTQVGMNSVRLPINEPTVLQPWWDAYRGSIDAGIARGMKVIVAYWAWDRTTGRPTDMATFTAMWDKVVAAYADNNLVYFQIFNEPFGYQPADFINLAVQWIARYPNLPKGRIIVAGNFYDSDVRQQGADVRLNGTLLSLHIYPFSNASQTSVTGWRNMVATNLGTYGSRTIVTEWGAPMTDGTDFSGAGDGNNNTSFIVGMSGYLHDNNMGSCYWPILRTGDRWSLTALNGTGLVTVTNASGLARIRAAWNL